MENCHTWIIISKWQNDLHTNTSRSVWPILYGLMIKMLQYKMYPAGELAVLWQLLLYIGIIILRNAVVAGYCGQVGHPCVCPSISRMSISASVFRFRMITWVNVNGFSPNLVCALILWQSGLGLLMGKFLQILTELSARDMSIFSFLDDNLSKRQRIFTKLGVCIDIVEIWIWIANGQISSNFDRVICPRHAHIFVS